MRKGRIMIEERELRAMVLRFRYGTSAPSADARPVRTLIETADQYGITRQDVRMIEVRHFAAVRHPSGKRL